MNNDGWQHYYPKNGMMPPEPDTTVEGWCVITGWWGRACPASMVPWDGVNHVSVYRVVKPRELPYIPV